MLSSGMYTARICILDSVGGEGVLPTLDRYTECFQGYPIKVNFGLSLVILYHSLVHQPRLTLQDILSARKHRLAKVLLCIGLALKDLQTELHRRRLRKPGKTFNAEARLSYTIA